MALDILIYIYMVYSPDLSEQELPEGVKPIGNVIVDFENGIKIQWTEEGRLQNPKPESNPKPEIKEGDIYILALEKCPIMELTIGFNEDINYPVQIRWVNRKHPSVIPNKETPMILKVYPKPKQSQTDPSIIHLTSAHT